MKLTPNSITKLKGVHPDLVRVVMRCAKDWKHKDAGFVITCGTRTLAEQKVLLANKATRTLRSRHIPASNGFSHAVDFACTIEGKVRWDWPLYSRLAIAVKAAAKAEGVAIEWGGDWATFKDGPHFQLPWKQYPGSK
jgi:peptidoglycan LD-endopeptidase CwlK